MSESAVNEDREKKHFAKEDDFLPDYNIQQKQVFKFPKAE